MVSGNAGGLAQVEEKSSVQDGLDSIGGLGVARDSLLGEGDYTNDTLKWSQGLTFCYAGLSLDVCIATER